MNKAADGIFASLLAIVTALVALAACLLRWVVRLVWRHKSQVPYADSSLPALAAYGVGLLAFGFVPATLVVAGIGGWLWGAPHLERRRRDEGRAVALPLTFAASTARDARDRFATMHIRHEWKRAVKDLPRLQPVRIRKAEPTRAGYRLLVRFSRGQTAQNVAAWAPNLASELECRKVTVQYAPENQREGVVYIVQRDPLSDGAGRWPLLNTDRPSVWNPIPVGIDENGEDATLTLPESSVLIGGTTGSGKSNLVSMIVAAGALDPDCKLWLIDGKQVEFGPWRASAETVVFDPPGAIAVLQYLNELMEWRYAAMGLADGINRKIGPDSGHPLHLLVIDELADFTMAQGASREAKQAADQFNALLYSLIRKARAASIVIVGATQKPEGKVVPTYVRDQFQTRIALRCGNPQASDTILGSGKAQEGYSAAAPWRSGTALLYAVPRDPFKIAAFHVPDQDLATLIARAAEATTTEPRSGGVDADVPVAPAPVPDSGPVLTGDGNVGVGKNGGESVRALGGSAESHVSPATFPHPEPVRPDRALAGNVVRLPKGKGSKNAVRRLRIELELRERRGRSFRQIAEAVAAATGSTCDHHTVAAVARELERERSA